MQFARSIFGVQYNKVGWRGGQKNKLKTAITTKKKTTSFLFSIFVFLLGFFDREGDRVSRLKVGFARVRCVSHVFSDRNGICGRVCCVCAEASLEVAPEFRETRCFKRASADVFLNASGFCVKDGDLLGDFFFFFLYVKIIVGRNNW